MDDQEDGRVALELTQEFLDEMMAYKQAIAQIVMERDPEGLDPLLAVYLAADLMGSGTGTLVQVGKIENKEDAMELATSLFSQAYDAHLDNARARLFRN